MRGAVYLALGANRGRRGDQLARARRELERRGVTVLRASRIRETEPYGVTDQPRFLNQVLEVGWPGSPTELLEVTQAVERAVGRRPSHRWGPREIDVDLILFGDEVLARPELTIPHPGLQEREFVLEPLLELDPDLVHPVTGESLRETLAQVRSRVPSATLNREPEVHSPLRVAWLGHRSATGGDGIITYSREMTEGLRARGVEVIFFHHAPELVDAQSYALDGISLAHRLVISPPRAKRMLVELLRRHEVDVVHVSLSFSSLDFNLPQACHQLGIPIVATFHVPFDRRFSVWGGITSALYRVYAQALSECDRVIIFSETQRDILVKLGVPGHVVSVLANGVDVDKYSPGPSAGKSRFEAETMFSYMGRLDPEKNVDVLLRAFLDADPPPTTKLVVVGGGSDRRRLERRFRDSRVHFTGTITDEAERIAILRGSDAFFLPSAVEGLSLAMLEAMACGVATVATDVGSDGDALRGAGIVLDPQDLGAELRAAIRLLLEMPELRHVLGRSARERVVDRFSLARNLTRLMELYADLIRARAALPVKASRS